MPDSIRFRRAVLIALPLAALLIVIAVVATSGVGGSSAGAASTAKNTGSATVTRRDLVATDTQSGTLGFGGPGTVYNRLSGTITSLPVAGTVVKPGGTLFTVDNAPVILMNGAVPAYRSLSVGVSAGPDVKELEQNLRDLGFDPGHVMTIDETFDAATTASVDRWQASLGQTQTGTVTLGSVVFLPGPRRVSTVTASLGSTGGSSGAGASATAATASTRPVARSVFVDLTTPVSSSTSTTSTGSSSTSTSTSGAPGSRRAPTGPGTGSATSMATLQALVALLKAETAELRAELSAARSSGTKPAASGSASRSGGSAGGRSGAATGGLSGGSSGSASRASGASGGAGASGGSGSAAAGVSAQPVLQTTSTELVATVALDASKQSEAVPGQPVTVQMPDGSTVDGRISQVAAAATSSSSGSSSSTGGAAAGGSSSTTSTVPVTITLSGHRKTAGLDQAAVSVNFQQQKAAGVLAVPVTALLATAGGGYAIQEAAAPNRLIPITTGLFAAGYVQISGSGISDGLQVTDSQG